MKKKSYILLSLILFITIFTISSYAVEKTYDLAEIADGTTLNVSGTVKITDTSNSVKDIKVVCEEGTKLTIDGINIQTAGSPISFIGDDNELVLKNTNIVEATYGENPGISCGNDTTLAVKGDGGLTASGFRSGAGIGGGKNTTNLNITIESGTINATGGKYGAGIGGGYTSTNLNIIIEDGNITATGGENGAGIGSGDTNTNTNITIKSGTITAMGGENGAGIGSGENSKNLNITIESGTITAKTATIKETVDDIDVEKITGNGAGIGAGYYSKDININILDDAIITALGGMYAAGIGDGHGAEYWYEEEVFGNVYINIDGNNNITSTGGDYGAAIGGGYYSKDIDINITGNNTIDTNDIKCGAVIGGGYSSNDINISILGSNTVKAINNSSASGIGGGDYSNDIDIIINGNNIITASNESYGTGIGGGGSANNINIDISEGNIIEANGSNSSAAIGGGYLSNNIDINISNNKKITAISKDVYPSVSAAGIGGGCDSNIVNINISGNSEVIATSGKSGAGIGGGIRSNTINIDISNNDKINATGGASSAGIGGGYKSVYINININDNKDLTAISGNSSAGIGGGSTSVNLDIDITGFNKINATGGANGAGIGVGFYSKNIDINISGNSIISAGGMLGAGIGSTRENTGNGIITISGGKIIAIGDSKSPAVGFSKGINNHVNIKGDALLYAESLEFDIGNDSTFYNIDEAAVVFYKNNKITSLITLNSHTIIEPESESELESTVKYYGLPESWGSDVSSVHVPKANICYLGNGNDEGSAPTDAKEYEVGDTITVMSNSGDLLKPGYTFDCWNTSSDGKGTDYNPGDKINMGDSRILLYAKWIPSNNTPYTVEHYTYSSEAYRLDHTENLKGTTDATVNAVAKDYEGFVEDTNNLNRKATGIVAFDGTLVLKLYYVTYDYDVTFNSNTEDSVIDLPKAQKLNENDKATEPNEPSRIGYAFSGWYKEVGCENVFDFNSEEITIDTDIYAKWTAKTDTAYSINKYKQDLTGGGYTLADADELKGTTDTTVKARLKEYIGFNIKEGITSGNIASDGSLVLNIYYDRAEYGVVFNGNTDDVLINMAAEQTVNYEAKATKPNDPSRKGYIFKGWYEEKACNNLYDFNNEVTANVNLYAKWEANKIVSEKVAVKETEKVNEKTYKLIYDAGEYYKYSDFNEVFILSNGDGISKAGYVLKGWSNSKNSEIPNYLLGAMYKMPESDVTLYAVWQKDSDEDGISDNEEKAVGTDLNDFNDKPYKGNINVRLIDQDGNPITGITCILNSKPMVVEINSKGIAEFLNVDFAVHTLTLIKNNSVLATYTINFINGDVTEVIETIEGSLTSVVATGDETLDIVIKENSEGAFNINEASYAKSSVEKINTEAEETKSFNWVWLVVLVILIAVSTLVVRKKLKK